MIKDCLRKEEDKLGAGARGHHIKTIQAIEELIFVAYGIRVTKRERTKDHVSFLALKAFYGVYRTAEIHRRGAREGPGQATQDTLHLCFVRCYNVNTAFPKACIIIWLWGNRF